MTIPCRSSCPGADCAGCVFPPAADRPVTVDRDNRRRFGCVPSSPCSQATGCLRAERASSDRTIPVIDGTVAWRADDGRCPLFLDVRGAALVAAA